MVAAGVAASAMPHVLFNERGLELRGGEQGLGVLKRPTKLVEHHRVASRVACKKMTAATSETATENQCWGKNSGKCSGKAVGKSSEIRCKTPALCTLHFLVKQKLKLNSNRKSKPKINNSSAELFK